MSDRSKWLCNKCKLRPCRQLRALVSQLHPVVRVTQDAVTDLPERQRESGP